MREDLIILAKNGDKNALTKLIQDIQNDLYRIAKTRLSNNDDINDAIQNTMIKVYRKINTLKENNMFKSWVIKILINECNQIYKAKMKKEKLNEKVNNKLSISENNDDLQNINLKIDFETIFNHLEYEERLIITLYYNSGYSCSEISAILKMNINTVKSKLLRAKQKIKKKYEGRIYNG